MHDTEDPQNQIDRQVVESPEMLGKECGSCARILAYQYFNRDTSYADGRRAQCAQCESAPRLSLAEHTSRLRENNLSSHAVRKQRWEDQEEYRKDSARVGHRMHHTEFLRRIEKYVPNLYVIEGGVVGDLGIYLTYPVPQSRLDGRDFEYLTYIHEGVSNEFSTYEFNNDKDVPIREKWNGGRGWRTVLLKMIKKDLLTEEQAIREFGQAEGEGSVIYNKQLFQKRNTAVTAA